MQSPGGRSLPVLFSILLAGCAAGAPPAPPPPPTPVAGPTLAKAGDDYVLPAPIPDLTASVLVHTGKGTVPPEIMSVDQAADVLVDYDVIFLGEIHRHIGVHHAQMALFRAIYERSPGLSLSMEQFERDGQATLDDYLAGRIGEYTLADRVDIWQGYSTSWRPLVEFAKAHKLPVIAANAPGMVVRCVGIEGPSFLSRMKPEQRGWAAADLNLQDGPYKDKFMGFMSANPDHGGGADGKEDASNPAGDQALRAFAAQVTRDDTMAESIALHLQQHPGRKVVHLTGYFHSASFLGTVERLKLRRPDLKIAVVTPVEEEDGAPAKLTPDDLKSGTFLLVVQDLPEPYATEEEMRAAMKKRTGQREENKCEL